MLSLHHEPHHFSPVGDEVPLKLLPKHMERLAAVLRVKVNNIFHNITSFFLRYFFVTASIVAAFIWAVI